LSKAQHVGKKIKLLIRNEEKRKIQKNLTSPDPKTFWTLVKSLMGKKSTQLWEIKENGQSLIDKKIIAESFAAFFLAKVNNLKSMIPEMDVATPPPTAPNITIPEIAKAAKKLKNKKCSGPDGIPLIIIKDIGKYAPSLLLSIMNDFAKNGLPRYHKISKVIPLLKKGDPQDMKNYRPISNLSSIGKLFEKIILQRLDLELKDAEGDFQHAYRSKHSTTSALLEFQNAISKCLDDKLCVAAYSMDLSAAFDMLRPDIFSNFINSTTASNNLKFALTNFLLGRGFYVQIDDEMSGILDMPIGCAQGSILGPKLFTLYLSELRKHIDGDLVSYADDSYVVISAKTIE